MDAQTVDAEYAKLEQHGQQTAQLFEALAAKMKGAGNAGDPNAREWALDLREIALSVKEEEDQTSALLRSIHDVVASQPPPVYQQPQQQPPVYQQQPQPQYQQPQYQQPQYQQPQYQQPPQQSGFSHFLSGGIGRAIVQGAGFGIGDDLINRIL